MSINEGFTVLRNNTRVPTTHLFIIYSMDIEHYILAITTYIRFCFYRLNILVICINSYNNDIMRILSTDQYINYNLGYGPKLLTICILLQVDYSYYLYLQATDMRLDCS